MKLLENIIEPMKKYEMTTDVRKEDPTMFHFHKMEFNELLLIIIKTMQTVVEICDNA